MAAGTDVSVIAAIEACEARLTKAHEESEARLLKAQHEMYEDLLRRMSLIEDLARKAIPRGISLPSPSAA